LLHREYVPVYRTGKSEDDWACSMHARFENENKIKSKFLKGRGHFMIPKSRRNDNIKMYLKTYENEELTQLGHVGFYRRALLKPTLNCWVSSEAEKLLKSKTLIDLHRIIYFYSETPQTGP
jgi:hypothetical protein